MHFFYFFFFNDTATTEIYTLSLHDALPIFTRLTGPEAALEAITSGAHIPAPRALELGVVDALADDVVGEAVRSEEHTSELQSQSNLVCRLLLEKKKQNTIRLSLARLVRDMS